MEVLENSEERRACARKKDEYKEEDKRKETWSFLNSEACEGSWKREHRLDVLCGCGNAIVSEGRRARAEKKNEYEEEDKKVNRVFPELGDNDYIFRGGKVGRLSSRANEIKNKGVHRIVEYYKMSLISIFLCPVVLCMTKQYLVFILLLSLKSYLTSVTYIK